MAKIADNITASGYGTISISEESGKVPRKLELDVGGGTRPRFPRTYLDEFVLSLSHSVLIYKIGPIIAML